MMDKREPRGVEPRSMHDPGGLGVVVMVVIWLVGVFMVLKVLGVL